MKHRVAFAVVLAGSLFLPLQTAQPVEAQQTPAACAGTFWLESSPEPETAAADAADPEPPAQEVAAWLTVELTDACSGQAFTLDGFAGRTVFVEAMATWCRECHGQLTRLREAAAQIPQAERQEVVLIALNSEIDLPREELARYAESNKFPFIFAVMPEAMLKAMVADLGREVAVPPATPHMIVAPNGTIGMLHTGGSSADELLALFAAARALAAP